MKHSINLDKIKAAFFDIDGTLVSFKTHSIPESALAAIRRVQQMGIRVFIATGRCLPFINNLQGVAYDGLLTVNGGACFAADGTVICNHPIPEDDIERLVKDSYIHPMPVILAGNDKTMACNVTADENAFNEVLQLINFPMPEIRPIEEALQMEVMQVVAFFPPEDEPRIMHDVMRHCDSPRWHPNFADCIPAGINKATGIDDVCRFYGIDVSQTIAFGDGGNDIPMLQHAGIGVAMGNAPDDVKQYADIITDSVDDDGIAKILSRIQCN